jgi:Fe-S cluster assembly protein SufD
MALKLETIKAELDAVLLKADPSWAPVRQAYWNRLQEVGLPKARGEAYTWVPLALLQNVNYADQASQMAIPAIPKSMVQDWTALAQGETDFSALLPALLSTSPIILDVPFLPDWQDIHFGASNVYTHNIINIPADAKVRLHWASSAPNNGFSSERLDLVVAEGAQVEVYEQSDENLDQVSLRHTRIQIGSKATVSWLGLDCGLKLNRSTIDAHLAGAQASIQFRALSLLDSTASSHRRLQVFHEAPDCSSDQFVRHMLLGSSQASCASQVEIKKNITGSKAHQLINSLLLSREAKASAKPTLLIHNDEVVASHGTTCGDLDTTQLFYLQSRGLSAPVARRVLVSAFVQSLFDAQASTQASKAIAVKAMATLARRFQ